MKAKVLAAALLMALTTTTALAQGQQGRGSKEQSVRIERRDMKGAKAPMVKKEMQKRARHDGRRDFAQCQQCRKGHQRGRQFCHHHHGHQHRHQQAQVIIIRV